MHCNQLEKQKQKKKNVKKNRKKMDAQSFFDEAKKSNAIDNKLNKKNANGYYENIVISIEINHAANLAKNSA